jgi:hypothetical protein
MSIELSPGMSQEIQEAMQRLLSGVHDPQIMQRACERMDRIREEIRQKHGVLEIGVPAIRELRDA